MSQNENRDDKVISHFGGEWKKFNYLDEERLSEIQEQFDAYLTPLPQDVRGRTDLAIGDFGAGSGRWAHFFLNMSSQLWLVEPGSESFAVLKERFLDEKKVHLLNQTVSENDIPDASLDLSVSLGVLHHIPDTLEGIRAICKKTKPGGYFLCYLYYAMENKPVAYRLLWRISNTLRTSISKMPYRLRRFVCEVIAAITYYPLARLSKFVEALGKSSRNIPLHHYRDMTFYVMRNDAYDRFGTSLEQRFTRDEISEFISKSGFDLSTLVFSNVEPFWTFSVKKQ
ncbi:MAG: class I SAM-dependent methyltransferase [Actinobacteria bacterium]|nr:class I SAM-dependent methyltransferase [Actinomycetota bacterium]